MIAKAYRLGDTVAVVAPSCLRFDAGDHTQDYSLGGFPLAFQPVTDSLRDLLDLAWDPLASIVQHHPAALVVGLRNRRMEPSW